MYRWPTVPARARLARLAVVPCLVVPSCRGCGTGTCPTTAPSCRAVPRGTGGTIVLSRGGRRADVGGRLHARRLGAEGGERTTAACATASGQELRASSAVGGRSCDVGGGGLRSGGEGRSCGGLRPSGRSSGVWGRSWERRLLGWREEEVGRKERRLAFLCFYGL
jgi:hypothetical protein